MAQGWPSEYEGVMLQGFYWDSYQATKWTYLESQADELANNFTLVWLPQSGNCAGTSMGYDDYYWFPGGSRYNSSFGTEAELRSLISTFKDKGIGTIADVVINHRKSNNGWFGFPAENYKGVTYKMTAADVCSDDDGGKAKTQADKQGLTLGATDTGEDWDGMRDLDHSSTNVQTCVKAYLHALLEDLGYAGFRYDMVKGYHGRYTGMYNADAQPKFSVGEYWDANVSAVTAWMRYTRLGGGRQAIESAAFDFPFRYTVRNALRGSANDNNTKNWKQDVDYTLLGNNCVIANADYRRYAVTFVENHDTEYRSSTAQQDPIRRDTLAANALLLANAGTPCVFLKHWMDYKHEISSMIAVRRAVALHNESEVTPHTQTKLFYAATAVGKKGSMMVAVGNDASTFSCEGYTKVLEGYHYAYFMGNKMETAWADVTNGVYGKNLKVKLAAVSQQAGAKVVYTLDGSTPTPSSTAVASGSEITIPSGRITLTAGLLVNGTVTGIIVRNYEVGDFEPTNIDIYVNVDQVSWTNCNFFAFGGDGSHSFTGWPGETVTDKQTINGEVWYHKQYPLNSRNDYLQFVFSAGTGSPQTVDSNPVKQSTFFRVLDEKSGTKHKLETTTLGINNPVMDNRPADNRYYNLAGQRVLHPQKGLYIVNGKVVLIK